MHTHTYTHAHTETDRKREKERMIVEGMNAETLSVSLSFLILARLFFWTLFF